MNCQNSKRERYSGSRFVSGRLVQNDGRNNDRHPLPLEINYHEEVASRFEQGNQWHKLFYELANLPLRPL